MIQVSVRLWSSHRHALVECAEKLNIHLSKIMTCRSQKGGYYGYGVTRDGYFSSKEEITAFLNQ